MAESTLANLWRSGRTFTAGDSYFEYERRVGREILIPFLERYVDLAGLRVADFGCHQGGVLAALREDGRVEGGVGYELSQSVLDVSPFVPDDRFHLERRDLLTLGPGVGPVDLVLLCEVLEHIPESERMMEVVRQVLSPSGHALVTFPPYRSPFGGHQQYASTWLRFTPYAHYLPEAVVLRLARIEDTAYMRGVDAVEDMRSVRRTRLSLRRAERAFRRAGLEVRARTLYVLRPEYFVRYGLRPRVAHVTGRIPGLREIATMGAYYLLRRSR
jgi:SAM-dependent methyltransferase